jgi:multiple sugar transport system substrate-binding protein
MTTEIEFSIQAPAADLIQPLLAEFEAKYHIQVKLRLLTWDAAWSELVKVALYNDGPDISEVGSTWLGDLTAMGALHAFQPDEITHLGRASRFLPAAWQGCQMPERPEVWAIPWLVGARLVLFRRDLLLRTGVDEMGLLPAPRVSAHPANARTSRRRRDRPSARLPRLRMPPVEWRPAAIS